MSTRLHVPPPGDGAPLAAPLNVAGRYELLAWVNTPSADLVWTYDAQAVGLLPALGAEIREEVHALEEDRRSRGLPLRLEDNPLYRVLAHEVKEGRLVLRLGRTSYFHTVATRSRGVAWLRRHGPAALSNGLGVCGPTTTADGLIVLAPRGAAVASNPGLLDVVPAGHAHPPEHPLEAFPREGVEELGLATGEILEQRCLGLMRNPAILKFDIVSSLRLSVPWATLSLRHREDAWETGEFLTVREEPEALACWLIRHIGDTSPSGHASLLLHGRALWGDAWLARVVRQVGANPASPIPL